MPKAIDKVRKKAKDFLGDLQVECRLKLTEWEAEQVEIKAAKEESDRLQKMLMISRLCGSLRKPKTKN